MNWCSISATDSGEVKTQTTVDIIGLPLDVAAVFCSLLCQFPIETGAVPYFDHLSALKDVIWDQRHGNDRLAQIYDTTSKRAALCMKEEK